MYPYLIQAGHVSSALLVFTVDLFCARLSRNILTEQEEVVDQWPCTVSTVSTVRLREIQNYRYTEIQFGNARNTEQEEAVDQ